MPPTVTIRVSVKMSEDFTITFDLHCLWSDWVKMRDYEKGAWVERHFADPFVYTWEETKAG